MLFGIAVVMVLSGCDFGPDKHYIPRSSDSVPVALSDTGLSEDAPQWNYADSLSVQYINPGKTKAEDLVGFAETLIGVPYRYASSNPANGFDCSGFITYVFNHFNIAVPRSSSGFTSVEREINLKDARRGDIILFTGTDSTKRVVGHMGIITSADNGHEFIHSTSGKAYGVTKTPLNNYYQGRFVKVIRIFMR